MSQRVTASMTPIRTGILGGSFNPAHGGHRRITLFAMEALNLDEVWWLVSPGNPLKSSKGMAPLPARIKSAEAMARRARIVPSSIETVLKTRFTVETLRKLKNRDKNREFVWLMGSDNLAQFHRWKSWREIARTMPIAVIARPGYNAQAMSSPAMAWFRRYRVPVASLRNRGQTRLRSAPALVFMRFDPDLRSATAIRRADSGWASQYQGAEPRDRLTLRRIEGWPQAGETA